MEFTKVPVPAVPRLAAAPPRGLLSATLSAGAPPAPASGRASPATTPNSKEGRPGESPSASNSPKRVGFTVGRAIAAILEAFFEAGGEVAAAGPGRPGADRFSLLVAEDDGCLADPDFPEIDSKVAITSVGVDKFVLVLRPGEEGGGTLGGGGAAAAAGNTTAGSGAGAIVLRVTIPQSAIALRACEAGMAAPQLALTCYLPAGDPGGEGGNGGLSKSFSVVLEGTGDAVPTRGLAAGLSAPGLVALQVEGGEA